ncbi:MAG TPA: rhodanese-like domain-containing protein [Holophaga sp.]|nr:rhodanese-like domain-containing protein [Holophaga sp.]
MSRPVPGLRFLSPREVRDELQAGACLVDLRTDELVEMKAFAVQNRYHIPHRFLATSHTELPKDRLLVLADTSGVYTKEAARLLLANGFTRIACLDGGMIAWEEAGMPLASDPDAEIFGVSPRAAATPKSKRPMIQSILFLSAANAARSQIAEGLARKMFPGLRIVSAGSRPATVHPMAVQVLREAGVDASAWTAKPVGGIDPASFGVVITLCAEEVCPALLGNVDRLHWPLPDPADPSLGQDDLLERFRGTREAISRLLKAFARERGLPTS